MSFVWLLLELFRVDVFSIIEAPLVKYTQQSLTPVPPFPVYSRISRESIDALKSHFKDELSNDDWRLVIDLKKVFGIV